MTALRWVSIAMGCVFAIGAVLSLVSFKAFFAEGMDEVVPDLIWAALFACLSLLAFAIEWALRKQRR